MLRACIAWVVLAVALVFPGLRTLCEENPKAGARQTEETRAEIERLREQLNQALARIEQLERLRGMAHYRFPQKVELLGGKLPLERRDLWERMDKEFLLLVNDVPQVLLWLKRARRYFPLLEERIQQRGLPADLKYVAIVESSLRPEARSSAGAVGIWQFIQSTGARYQLEITNWVDERQDPIRSTEAALSHLDYLYRKFGDWLLALAAYNAGEDRIGREMERQNVCSFYDLVLPSETERYVFRIASAKVILSDPKAYGFELFPEELYEPFQAELLEVDLERDLDLIAMAQACGMTYRALRGLNPHLREAWLPKGRYRVYVPLGKAQEVQDFIKRTAASAAQRPRHPPDREKTPQVRETRRDRIVHKVQHRETLWDIARKYGVQVRSVQEWNQLSAAERIRPGQRLIIYK